MSEKIEDELCKKVFQHFELKDNEKYLIYFSAQSADLFISVTDGLNVWRANLTSQSFGELVLRAQLNSLTQIDFLKKFQMVLKSDELEINKLLDAGSKEDFIEFKSFLMNARESCFKIVLKPVKSSRAELKSLVFDLYEKFQKVEVELVKIKGRSDFETVGGNVVKQVDASQTGGLKNFNISSASLVSRKPGMSLINPMTKRRKAPKGVEFEEGGNDNENEEDEEEKESLAATLEKPQPTESKTKKPVKKVAARQRRKEAKGVQFDDENSSSNESEKKTLIKKSKQKEKAKKKTQSDSD